MFKPK